MQSSDDLGCFQSLTVEQKTNNVQCDGTRTALKWIVNPKNFAHKTNKMVSMVSRSLPVAQILVTAPFVRTLYVVNFGH